MLTALGLLSLSIILSVVIGIEIGKNQLQSLTPATETNLGAGTTSTIETANEGEGLLTYTSTRFGYSFLYPEDWELIGCDDNDPNVITCTNSLRNYDSSEIELYMDDGIIDWSTFIGNKDAVGIDISVDTTSDRSSSNIENYKEDSTVLTDHGITIGGLTPTVLRSNSPGAGVAKDSLYLFATTEDKSIFIGLYGFELQGNDLLNSSSWEEIQTVLSSFEFSGD